MWRNMDLRVQTFQKPETPIRQESSTRPYFMAKRIVKSNGSSDNNETPKRSVSVGRSVSPIQIPNINYQSVRQLQTSYSGEKSGPYLDPQSDSVKGRKTLVLDLDETLIHSSSHPVAKPDFVVKASNGFQRFYVLKRPGLEKFLERANELFEVVVFTCGDREYATKVIKKIDPNGVISKILHREYCVIRKTLYTKDIGRLGRNLKNVIFIDNWEASFMLQPNNGYKIKDFINNRKDNELMNLIPFLEHLNELEDVRPVQQRYSSYIAQLQQQRLVFIQKSLEQSSSIHSPGVQPLNMNESSSSKFFTSKTSYYTPRNGFSTPTKVPITQTIMSAKPYKTQEGSSIKAENDQKSIIESKSAGIFSVRQSPSENKMEKSYSYSLRDRILELRSIVQPNTERGVNFIIKKHKKFQI